MPTFGKRVDGVDGRRSAVRDKVSLPVSMFSLEHSRVVILEDVSATGARLTGYDLPLKDEAVWIRVGPIDTFGIVVWNEPNVCGIIFDTPLGDDEAAFVQQEVRSATLTRLGPEERQALDDWRSGSVN